MDRLNKVASYFNEKERRRLDKIIQESNSGLPEMSVSDLFHCCFSGGGGIVGVFGLMLYVNIAVW